jgi:thiosulfate/3-mercaptopyruvate sulfurtransferase
MSASLPAGTRERVFIDVAGLKAARASGRHVVVLDIRFRPEGVQDGRERYLAGHIPEAVFVDFATELASEPRGFSGRRPLPEARDLQRDARRWGLREDSLVVVHDDNRNLQAGRAWWVLRWAGARDVRLLDGGLAAWVAADGALTAEVPLPARGDVVLPGGQLPVLDADAAQARARDAVLLDARGTEAYLGRAVTTGRPSEGHIPGALSAPTTQNLLPDGQLASAEALRDRFRALGVDGTRPVGVYCGGGVAASHQIAALASIGIEAALFPGSWSAWSSDPSRPVATGAEPG